MDQEKAKQLQYEKNTLAYRLGFSTLLIVLLIASYMAYLITPYTQAEFSLAWWLLCVGSYLARTVLHHQFQQQPYSIKSQRRWEIYYIIGAVISGLIWALGAVLFYPEGDLQTQVLISIVLLGLGLGVVAQSTYKYNASLFILSSFMPFAIRILLEPDVDHIFLPILVLTAVALIIISLHLYRNTLSRLGLGLNSEMFINKLKEENQHARQLNVELAEQVKEEQRGQHRMHVLADAAFDALFLYRGDKILDVNKAACDMTGYSHDELVGMSAYDLAPVEIREFIQERLVIKDDLRHEGQLLRKNGEVVPVVGQARDYPVEGETLRVVALNSLQSERQKERELNETRKELLSLLENMQDTYYRTNRQGEVVLIGNSVKGLLGYEPDEFLGSLLSSYYWEQGGREKFLAHLQENDGMVKGYEAPLRHKDNYPVWVSTNAQYVKDEEGNIVGIEGTTRDISDKRDIELELENQKNNYRDLFIENRKVLENSPAGIIKLDKYFTLIYMNPLMREILGLPEGMESAAMNRDIREIDTVITAGLVEFVNQIPNKSVSYIEVPFTSLQDKTSYLSIRAVPTFDNGTFSGAVCLVNDISDLRKTEGSLFYERERALTTLSSIADGVLSTNNAGEIDYANRVVESYTNQTADDMCGHKIGEVIRFYDENGEILDNPAIKSLNEGSEITINTPVHLLNESLGDRVAVTLKSSPIRDDRGKITGSVLVFHDVSEIQNMANELSYQATHDPLTGLINRREFERLLREAIVSANVSKQSHVLCYIDLDQFKVVNDTCGHMAGDDLLRSLVPVMSKAVRGSDVVARLGGDEFALLLYGCSLEQANELVGKLIASIQRQRFTFDNKVFDVGASIGIVEVNSKSNVADVLSAADSACYIAKDKGRNRAYIHLEADSEMKKHKISMEMYGEINRALEEDRFTLFIQPIKTLNSDVAQDIYGEILLRMKDSDDNIIQPVQFIPAAERYNLMPGVDGWVVRNALQSIRHYRDSSRCEKDNIFTINLSGQSISEAYILTYIKEQIEDSGIQPSQLCFEITETAAVNNIDTTIEFINSLKQMGCKFALDDFGSGVSSLVNLKHLPVDFIKIDGELIREFNDSPISRVMVRSVVEIAAVMGAATIAEYVEDGETLNQLQELGIDYAQGYHISHPLEM